MFPNSWYPNSYFEKFYFPKSGAGGFVPPVVTSSGASQLLPIMGIGCWLLMVLIPW